MLRFDNFAVHPVGDLDLTERFFIYPLELPVMPTRNRDRSLSRRRLRSGETLYFAFGSNLWLRQMAERCPDSRYVGRAVLKNFQWQINQRGTANIMPCQGGHVEGLCYLLSANDEARLDRSEGVPTAYEKARVAVKLFRADPVLAGRKTSEIVARDLVRTAAQRAARRDGECLWFPCSYTVYSEPVAEEVHALIYISTRHILNSAPRQEYRERMLKGIRDARQLGVSSTYISNVIRPALERN